MPGRRVMSILLFLLGLYSFTGSAAAETVTPAPHVQNGIWVYQAADSDSTRIAFLRRGEQAELLSSVPRWYRVRAADGTVGYVSKRSTDLVEASSPGPSPVTVAPAYTVHVIDVGTGLAVFVTGQDFALLYDGGSNDDLARGADNRLVAYLRAVAPNLTTIDHIVLSHPHRDHVELLPDVFAVYDVKQVWDSGAVNEICGYRAFITSINTESGVVYHSARNGVGTHPVPFKAQTCYGQPMPATTVNLAHGERIGQNPVSLGAGATISFLHADGSPHQSFNENSLVTRLDLGTVRLLLMGDAEAGGRNAPSTTPGVNSIEGKLLACCAAALKADILVVGHHGSRTSSRKATLDAVAAQTFVISSGPMKYGSVVLPDSDVVDELDGRGTVWRTDRDDGSCRITQSKIGHDADNRAGGCDNVIIDVSATGGVSARYWMTAD